MSQNANHRSGPISKKPAAGQLSYLRKALK